MSNNQDQIYANTLNNINYVKYKFSMDKEYPLLINNNNKFCYKNKSFNFKHIKKICPKHNNKKNK